MARRKYSKRFESDWLWYKSVISIFCNDDCIKLFTGGNRYENIKLDVNGVDAKKAFFVYDSHGRLVGTTEPKLLEDMMDCKASVNLHIKMYAEGRADGTLPKIEFINVCKSLKAPFWFYKAVEMQKYKYYKNTPMYQFDWFVSVLTKNKQLDKSMLEIDYLKQLN